jgi:predicted metal-dependent hydrolase
MCFDKNVIDYVIIHELCHLKEMNHGENFWKLVERFVPDYKQYVKKLRTLNYQE